MNKLTTGRAGIAAVPDVLARWRCAYRAYRSLFAMVWPLKSTGVQQG
ncbi:hypothetical protein J4733_29170 [Klebsiella pneumoniae]|uniref:Uncharacterized protein n=1 Tax=Klebsiella pneumoniae TaxID=573 RepID=A0A939NMG2_KLEPN|nr:hypothetical protein [Klebsiella pneumoniae]